MKFNFKLKLHYKGLYQKLFTKLALSQIIIKIIVFYQKLFVVFD